MSEQLESIYFDPPYCEYCGGMHDNRVCEDEYANGEEEEDEDD